jgi:hypothetical protein
MPRWLEGARVASQLLTESDPGRRYWEPENVQVNDTRRSDNVIVARTAILGMLMLRLDKTQTKKQFGWLLRGQREHVFQIHGMLGFSPKLLHMIFQITRTAAGLSKVSNCILTLLWHKC